MMTADRIKDINGDIIDVLNDLTNDYNNSSFINASAKKPLDKVSDELCNVHILLLKFKNNIKQLNLDIIKSKLVSALKDFYDLSHTSFTLSDDTFDDFDYLKDDTKHLI